jgi:hypothetical protein
MKVFLRSLATILSFALICAVFAIADDGVITGTVVRMTSSGDIVINDGTGNFEFVCAGDFPTPKEGEKVRVHYYHCGSGRKGFHHCADKIEKVSNVEKDSRNK